MPIPLVIPLHVPAIKVVLACTPLATFLKSSMSTWPRCQEGHILQNSPAYPGQNDSKVPINPLGLSILSKPPACPWLPLPQHLIYKTASWFIKQLSSWMQHFPERVTGQGPFFPLRCPEPQKLMFLLSQKDPQEIPQVQWPAHHKQNTH